MLGIGMTKCYDLLNSGKLKSIKVDGLRLISIASIETIGQPPEPHADVAG
jgi:hypothetical protein